MDQRAALSDRGDMLRAPCLTWNWGVQLTPEASIRAVHQALPDLLRQVEARGIATLQALPCSGLDPLAYRLFQLKVHMVFRQTPTTGSSIVTLFTPNTFSWNGDTEMIVAWCEALLQQQADVPAKLAASEFTERHAYLIPTMEGDLTIYRAMFTSPPGGDGPSVIPTTDPTLPEGVDQVWIRGLDRAIMWAPTTGWVQVAKAQNIRIMPAEA